MVDYTKYVLKSKDELEGLLAGKDNFFVVAPARSPQSMTISQPSGASMVPI